MRNPLKRRPHDPAKPSLRERLAAAREKYGRTLAVHRAMNAPAAAPAVDRAALVNYASWLFMERRMVCRELYPHMGAKADKFVVANTAADRFHFPATGEFLRGEPTAWKASARAVPVLDLVGVDWRADRGDPDLDEVGGEDTDERPDVPFGWPRIDAGLLEALDDLNRLDAAQVAMGKVGPNDRDIDTLPGYIGLETARYDALARLGKLRAESLIGLQAKARALLTPSVSDMGGEAVEDIAESLARDLLGLSHHAMTSRPDPIFAAIEEAWRLTREHGRLLSICGGEHDDHPTRPPERAAHAAMWDYVRDALLKTVPRTAEGCRALARFAVEFTEDQGVPIDPDGNDPVLALIARSPLL